MGLLQSKFETYLFDEELETVEEKNEKQHVEEKQTYPEGFFTEL